MATSPGDIAIITLNLVEWRAPRLAYLLEEVLLPERTEDRWIARCTKTFITLGDELYKRSPSGVLMKCVPTNQGKQLLLEVHARIYRYHMVLSSLVRKAFHQGFYWPVALQDAEEVIPRCEECQFYARQTHLSTQELQTIPITWPFAVWASTW